MLLLLHLTLFSFISLAAAETQQCPTSQVTSTTTITWLQSVTNYFTLTSSGICPQLGSSLPVSQPLASSVSSQNDIPPSSTSLSADTGSSFPASTASIDTIPPGTMLTITQSTPSSQSSIPSSAIVAPSSSATATGVTQATTSRDDVSPSSMPTSNVESQGTDTTNQASQAQSSSDETPSIQPDSTSGATTWTAPNGHTIVSSSSVFIIGGSVTATIPRVSDATTLTTAGETFTLLSPSNSLSATASFTSSFQNTTLLTISSEPTSAVLDQLTTILPDGHTAVSSSGFIIIDRTFTLPVPTTQTVPVTVTTAGETFAFPPIGVFPTAIPISSTSSSSSVILPGALVTYSTWPPGAVIVPVTTSTDQPEETGGGVVVPCSLWFFFVSIFLERSPHQSKADDTIDLCQLGRN
jgi:hypothetical protein